MLFIMMLKHRRLMMIIELLCFESQWTSHRSNTLMNLWLIRNLTRRFNWWMEHQSKQPQLLVDLIAGLSILKVWMSIKSQLIRSQNHLVWILKLIELKTLSSERIMLMENESYWNQVELLNFCTWEVGSKSWMLKIQRSVNPSLSYLMKTTILIKC